MRCVLNFCTPIYQNDGLSLNWPYQNIQAQRLLYEQGSKFLECQVGIKFRRFLCAVICKLLFFCVVPINTFTHLSIYIRGSLPNHWSELHRIALQKWHIEGSTRKNALQYSWNIDRAVWPKSPVDLLALSWWLTFRDGYYIQWESESMVSLHNVVTALSCKKLIECHVVDRRFWRILRCLLFG